jgi:putative ABC transport system permease protein
MRWQRRKHRRTDDDFAAELQSHLEHEADEHIGNGAAAADARERAQRQFGNVTRVREDFRESRRVVIVDQLVQDVRAARRGLARYPIAATVAVLSLAAGIGSTTATLTVRNAVFRNPPPLYREPAELSRVRVASPRRQRGPVPAALFAQWMQDSTLRSAMAAAGPSNARDARVDDRLDTLTVRPVTPELFRLLGVEPALGRTFDATANAASIPAVISYPTWMRLFEGRPDALGKTLWLDRTPHVVVGVMPQRFWVISMNDAVWTPLDWQTAARQPETTANADDFDVIARDRGIAPGRMLEMLESGLASYRASLPAGQRELRVLTSSVRGTPLAEQIAPYVVWLLGASVFLTLSIACTNVAILVIAQWTAREHEIAIRASLGASRGRVVRTLLMESMLMAALGGGLGICVTLVLAGVLSHGDGASMFTFSIDPWILLQAMVVTVLAGIVTGLAPALYETRRAQRNPSQLPMSSDRVRQRWRHALVVFEIAVTIALLVVVTATVSSYRRMLTADVGYDTHSLIMARANVRKGVSIHQMLDAIRATPGVVAVSPASAVPPGSGSAVRPVAADARSSERLACDFSLVGADYFDALGVRVLMGRGVSVADVSSGASVAVVNQELVTRVWPRPEEQADAIGRFISIDDVRHQIIGVVPNFKGMALSPDRPAVYVPLPETSDLGHVNFAIRVSGHPSALVAPIRRALIDLDGRQRGIAVFTLDDVVAVGGREVLSAVLPMVPLIATALLLVAAGLYGVLTFAITRRSQELAIRLAIGATHKDLRQLVMRQSARLVFSGALLGIGLTFLLTRLVQGRGGIFEAPGVHTFFVPLLVVSAVGIVATLGPFRRAMRVSPVALLRSR